MRKQMKRLEKQYLIRGCFFSYINTKGLLQIFEFYERIIKH